MQTFQRWLAESVLGSALRTAIAVGLSLAVADWTTDGGINFEHWSVWLFGAVLSFVPALIAWLNPADPRWGKGKATP